jgi:acyl-coenzyme A synthetase/AMP-(fatty) acid ligase
MAGAGSRDEGKNNLIVTPLSTVLAKKSEHKVCFDRQGREVYWPEFVRTVAGLAGRLAETDSRYWAVDTEDSFEFGCALFACWGAGKTPVLTPAHLLADARKDLNLDGVIASRPDSAATMPIIAFDQLSPADALDGIIPAASDLILFTSGSTGQPMQVQRTIRHFEAELDVLESVFGQRMAECPVYSTVSHRHVYGMLFRLLWPLVTERAFATYDFDYPENLLGEVAEDAALVSSPALLKRIGHLPEQPGAGWRIIFSSGGMLPEYAAKDAARLLGSWPAEVLGSTETSGVAWRQQEEMGAATPWHTLPEVRIRQDDQGFLEVSSPFTGLSGWHRMGDKVALSTLRTFELLGRGDHIVKIEDKRVSLAEIEQHAMAHPWVIDAAAVALDDDARQYIGVVLQLNDDGQAEMQSRGRADVNKQIKQWLREKTDPVALPRRFRYEDKIPADPQGKRQPAIIRQLFDQQ